MSNGTFDESKIRRDGDGKFGTKDGNRDDAGQLDDAALGAGNSVAVYTGTQGETSQGNEYEVQHSWPQDDGNIMCATVTYYTTARVTNPEDVNYEDWEYRGGSLSTTHDLSCEELDEYEKRRITTPVDLRPTIGYSTVSSTHYQHLSPTGVELDSRIEHEDEHHDSYHKSMDDADEFARSKAESENWEHYMGQWRPEWTSHNQEMRQR